MKKVIIVFFVFFAIGGQALAGDEFRDDIANIQKFNPDGQKYEFMKNYIEALGYLKYNARRSQQPIYFTLDNMEDIERVIGLRDNIILDNVNIRVARNYLQKYRISPNGLILKVVDLFVESCNDLIAFNREEKALLDQFYDAQIKEQMGDFNIRDFNIQMNTIANQRKESLKKMLEASLLIQKVLISDQVDEAGNLTRLGITQNQRAVLLLRLDEFYEEGYQGELRQGQTFLQGSISALREILEDRSWGTIEASAE